MNVFTRATRRIVGVSLVSVFVATSAAGAQVSPEVATATSAEQAPATATAPCKKKKKGIGLGGVLKAARNSGLGHVLGSSVVGRGGALANVAVNTALEAGVAAATTSEAEKAAAAQAAAQSGTAPATC